MTCQSSKRVSEGCHCTLANIININTVQSLSLQLYETLFPLFFQPLSVKLVLCGPADSSRQELDDSEVQSWKQLRSMDQWSKDAPDRLRNVEGKAKHFKFQFISQDLVSHIFFYIKRKQNKNCVNECQY